MIPLPFILGGFRCLMVDPPWHFKDQAGRLRLPYRSMSDAVILALPFAGLAADNAHMYLWTTAAHRELAHRCMQRWGFVYKHDFWCKVDSKGRSRFSGGHYGRHAHEACLFGVRGRLGVLRHDVHTWFTARLGRHSQKPARIYEIAEALSPPPRIDLFARAPVPRRLDALGR